MQLSTINTALTMSSREIASLTGKQLNNVHRDIRSMLIELYGAEHVEKIVPEQYRNRHSEFIRENAENILNSIVGHDSNRNHQDNRGFSWERDTRGYIKEFNLNKDLTLTLIAGYNVKLRLTIVKRWQELEATVAFTLPKTFGEALRLAAEQQEKIEQQQAQLLIAAPKVAYVDTFVDHGVNKNITAVAKDLGVSGKKLGQWLRYNKFAFRQKGKMMWYQPFMDSGYGVHKAFNTKTEDKNGTSGTQALVTPKGDLFIKDKYKAKPEVPSDFEEVEVD